MSQSSGFRRLRTYLMGYFIPLTAVPLAVLAVFAYFLVSEAVNREIAKRAGPELTAVSRNIDTMERRMEKLLSDVSRKSGVQNSLRRRDLSGRQSELSTILSALPFDRVRAFTIKGELLADVKAADASRINKQWAQFFGPRSQQNLKEKAALYDNDRDKKRLPATQKNGAPAFDFLDSKKGQSSKNKFGLTKNFLKHLRSEDFFGIREVSVEGSVFAPGRPALHLLQYKLIFDAAYRPLGFLEGRMALDSERLKILADYQGVDLILMDSSFQHLSSSQRELSRQFSKISGSLKKNLSLSHNLVAFSQEMHVGRDPVEFFFTPLGADPVNQKLTAGWMGVGLNKKDQIQLRNQLILWISLLAAGLGMAVMAITIRVSDRITKPVTELVRATEMMKQGEWVHPVDSDAQTEIGVLVKRFNEMAQNVQVTKRALELKLEELASAHGELTKTQGQLVQSAKMSSLGQLVAGVAHELNNPIAFIYSNMTQMRGYLKNLEKLDRVIRLLEEKIPEQDAKFLKASLDEIEWAYVRQDMGEMVQSCLDGSIRVKDIVLGLRNFSRLDKGEIAEIDANRSLENTAKLLSSEIKNRVEVIWDLCPDARMRANTSQINQVFMNIMANGLQSIEGRGKVWIKTSIEKSGSDEFMVISIRDSGRGIKSEHIDKIFDPFFTTKKVGEGTGLGLSIVYGIIERHRGTINVKSRMEPANDHGTEFIIRLPRWGIAMGARDPESAA